MIKRIKFERALFLSWYCAKPNCTFCYMSTIKDKIPEPRKARRHQYSVLAETIIAESLGWEIEFLSAGLLSWSIQELADITKDVSSVTKKKQWLNAGIYEEEALKRFLPYTEGMIGTVECINPEIRKKVCPTKPIEDVMRMFSLCDKLGLKKGITIIIGLGESEKDIATLIKFIRSNNISRITFYRLIPHKGTPFYKGPETEYYLKWIRAVRSEFPNIHITAGSWSDKIEEVPLLMEGGADAFTKFRGIRYFNTEEARRLEKSVKEKGMRLESSFKNLDSDKIVSILESQEWDNNKKKRVGKFIEKYMRKMERRR